MGKTKPGKEKERIQWQRLRRRKRSRPARPRSSGLPPSVRAAPVARSALAVRLHARARRAVGPPKQRQLSARLGRTAAMRRPAELISSPNNLSALRQSAPKLAEYARLNPCSHKLFWLKAHLIWSNPASNHRKTLSFVGLAQQRGHKQTVGGAKISVSRQQNSADCSLCVCSKMIRTNERDRGKYHG